MKWWLLLFLPLVAACGHPRADGNGFEVGNGGIVVVCPGEIEVLDLYRARFAKKAPYAPDLGTGDRLRTAIARLSRLDPARARRYQKSADTFWARAKFVDGLALPDTRDYGDLPSDPACRVEQAVLQKPGNDVRFLVSRAAWDKLDETRRAALVLHEIVYEEAIGRHQKDSRNVQALVAALCARDIDRLSQTAYNQMMIRLGLADAHEQPPIWRASPVLLDDIYCGGIPLEIDLRSYVYHPAKDLLAFEPVSLPASLTLDSSGILRGTPGTPPIVRATNGRAWSDAEIAIDVRDCARDPIELTWRATVLQHGTLPTVPGRTWVKESGPEWLFFNPRSGDLSGTAPAEGDYAFIFAAGDLRVHLSIKVLPLRPERWIPESHAPTMGVKEKYL